MLRQEGHAAHTMDWGTFYLFWVVAAIGMWSGGASRRRTTTPFFGGGRVNIAPVHGFLALLFLEILAWS